jgi:hypothetical protein
MKVTFLIWFAAHAARLWYLCSSPVAISQQRHTRRNGSDQGGATDCDSDRQHAEQQSHRSVPPVR